MTQASHVSVYSNILTWRQFLVGTDNALTAEVDVLYHLNLEHITKSTSSITRQALEQEYGAVEARKP